MVSRTLGVGEAAGSIPASPTNPSRKISSTPEHEAAGSTPVAPTNFNQSMNPERGDFNPDVAKPKPNALVEKARLWVERFFKPMVEGLDNLRNIPEGTHIIFAPTHLSDYDVPIAIAALGEYAPDPVVAEESTHFNITQNPAAYLGRVVAGKDLSMRVDFSSGKPDRQPVFNPENFEPMRKALEADHPMFFAAYYNPKYPGGKWELPKQGGNGAAYLAEITPNTVVVPVAIDIRSEKEFGMGSGDMGYLLKSGKLEVRVMLGEPITPEPIPDIEIISQIVSKRGKKEEISTDELDRFRFASDALRRESNRIMKSLAMLLPKEKRGKKQG